jgi:hypothetical protein
MISIFAKKITGRKKEDGMLTSIWKDKRHNHIYYFSAAVLALTLAFVINLVSITIMYNQRIASNYANTTVFTPNVVTSLSGAQSSVMLYRMNTQKNQIFILMHMADMTGISLDLSMYEILVTDANKDMKRKGKPKENIKGQLYMFGMTGYIGIYLYTEEGQFSNEYKWITVRNYNPATSNRTPRVQFMAEDAQFDQFHIFVNPGSEAVRTIDFLENHQKGTDLDAVAIYKHTISESLESEIKDEISSSLSELAEVRMSIGEYRRRLAEDYGMEVPDVAAVSLGLAKYTISPTSKTLI